MACSWSTGSKRSKEKYGEPKRAIEGAELPIDYPCVQSASILYARRMRIVYHAGPPRQIDIYQVGNISPDGLVVRQAATFKPPAAARWLVVHLISLRTLYMARTHGVELLQG